MRKVWILLFIFLPLFAKNYTVELPTIKIVLTGELPGVTVRANPSKQQQFINTHRGTLYHYSITSGIPYNTTIAQVALETDWGTSTLYELGNWWGIKTWDKNVKSVNIPDDYVWDRFEVFEGTESLNRHHEILQNPRYKKCWECGDDWRCWNRELENAGYATSRLYEEKPKFYH
jgi:flagellum-specific peptidoglycan hydrolase FlgJ